MSVLWRKITGYCLKFRGTALPRNLGLGRWLSAVAVLPSFPTVLGVQARLVDPERGVALCSRDVQHLSVVLLLA